MMTIRTSFRFARIGCFGLLLAAAMLTVSAQRAAAAEMAATPVSTVPAQMQGAGQSHPTLAPTPDTTQDLCPTGMVGFGWG